MLHGAAKDADELRATWRALEAAVRMGKIRWLGVSNFDTKSLEALLGFATVAPAVVQNKMDVYHQVGVVCGLFILKLKRLSVLLPVLLFWVFPCFCSRSKHGLSRAHLAC